jgi:HD-GYP domain-containing protein (c-di-GMP phosphodiesterase class II)
MLAPLSVNLGNLLLSLSDAMDLADPSIALHQQRTAFIAWELAKAAGLPDEAIESLFVAGLLHDIGALSPEEKISIHQFEEAHPEVHCARSEVLLESVPWLRPAAQIAKFHHQGWLRWQDPISTPIVLQAQILFLADYIERLLKRDVYILHQDHVIADKIAALSGTSVHPDVVDLFKTVSRREEFWLDLASPRLYSLLLHNGPYRRVEIDLAAISTIGELFRNIIDFRSRFTSTHSSGVAECAASLAKLFGFSDSEVALMRVAGNFHDLGKLAVPNSILNKPDKLTPEEFAVMRQHTYFTFSVLNTIGGLRTIAEWAAFHHEKLDGSGYPFHHSASNINTGCRIMTVSDIFTALAEDRPYRPGMQRAEIERILKNQAALNKVDKHIVELLLDNYDAVLPAVMERQATTRAYYEEQFVVLDDMNGSAPHPHA